MMFQILALVEKMKETKGNKGNSFVCPRLLNAPAVLLKEGNEMKSIEKYSKGFKQKETM